MGAMISIAYDTKSVSNDEATLLATNIQSLVVEVMGEKDVFVYVDAKPITVAVDPIEVFIQVNAQKLADPTDLMTVVAEKLGTWKQGNNFQHSINLNVIPVAWYSKIGI